VSEAHGTSRRWLYWLPAIVVMAAIFLLSSQSGLRVSEDAAVDKPFRITGHLLAYALLAALLLLADPAVRAGRPLREMSEGAVRRRGPASLPTW